MVCRKILYSNLIWFLISWKLSFCSPEIRLRTFRGQLPERGDTEKPETSGFEGIREDLWTQNGGTFSTFLKKKVLTLN